MIGHAQPELDPRRPRRLFWGLIAFTPLLGWMYWFVLPVAIVGPAIGALSSRNGGRNLNLVMLGVGIARLLTGHGIF